MGKHVVTHFFSSLWLMLYLQCSERISHVLVHHCVYSETVSGDELQRLKYQRQLK